MQQQQDLSHMWTFMLQENPISPFFWDLEAFHLGSIIPDE
jgi:hypothetical protein